MSVFRYKAIAKSGGHVSGTIEAYDEFQAVEKIKEKCDVVLKVEQVQQKTGKKIDLNEPISIKEKTLSLVSSQFAILLRSGLPIPRTVEVVAEQTSDKYMKRILQNVAGDVAAGYTLSTAMSAHGKKFPATFIETIRAGEESGSLDKSFDRLAIYYDKRSKLKAKVKSAMTYPIILVILSIIVVTVVIKVAVPTISEVIGSTGGEMPVPTQILLGVYNFFEKYGLVLLVIIAVLVIALRLWAKKSDKGKMYFSQLSLKLPIIGKVNRMNAASQFASTMVTLLASGLPLNKCVVITGRVMDNYAAGTSVSKTQAGLEEGRSFGSVLFGNPYLPPLLVEMASVGEESGALEDTLATIGVYYDSEVETTSTRALGMLEPILTIFLGVVIGFIVLALYMPMFTMYNGF